MVDLVNLKTHPILSFFSVFIMNLPFLYFTFIYLFPPMLKFRSKKLLY